MLKGPQNTDSPPNKKAKPEHIEEHLDLAQESNASRDSHPDAEIGQPPGSLLGGAAKDLDCMELKGNDLDDNLAYDSDNVENDAPGGNYDSENSGDEDIDGILYTWPYAALY